MRIFLIVILIIISSHCSFDNKTGIWNNTRQNEADFKREKRFKDFETLYSKEKSFDKIIAPPIDLRISLDSVKTSNTWTDEFYQDTNNLDNFSYKNLNELLLKSSKLTRSKLNSRIYFDGTNVVAADQKGNIIVYSLEQDGVVLNYNFYKKKFKKIKKKLSIILKKNTIYVVDNIGYFYALDYKNSKLIWAINNKVPFRSNLKVLGNKILASDQNNVLHVIDKNTGDKLKKIPTEETILKNDFKNSLAVNNNSVVYLNTYGSLYSFDNENLRINWFRNLNQSLDLNPTNLFFSNPVILYEDKVIISSDPYLYVLNSNNGATIFKTSITSITNPVISNHNLFLITKDNLLVCLNLKTGKIIYSIDIVNEIANFLQTKKNSINIQSLSLLNDKLFIILKNSYVVKFKVDGIINEITKLPSKIISFPIFVNESIIFVNKKNKLTVLN